MRRNISRNLGKYKLFDQLLNVGLLSSKTKIEFSIKSGNSSKTGFRSMMTFRPCVTTGRDGTGFWWETRPDVSSDSTTVWLPLYEILVRLCHGFSLWRFSSRVSGRNSTETEQDQDNGKLLWRTGWQKVKDMWIYEGTRPRLGSSGMRPDEYLFP